MNRREFHIKGHTYVVTRRFLPSRALRVRVVAYKGSLPLPKYEVRNEYRDYEDMHDGDRMFSEHIRYYEDAAR